MANSFIPPASRIPGMGALDMVFDPMTGTYVPSPLGFIGPDAVPYQSIDGLPSRFNDPNYSMPRSNYQTASAGMAGSGGNDVLQGGASVDTISYLKQTATPGSTMTTHGVDYTLSQLNPDFADKLSTAIQMARAEGIPAGIYSSYRNPAWGVGGFKDKANSLHSYGYATDIAGIGRPGSPTAKRFYEIATGVGLFNPYGPNNRKEWNHFQGVADKSAPAWMRQGQPSPEMAFAPKDASADPFAAVMGSPSRTLRKNMTGEDVRQLQGQLIAAGIPVNMDGSFGKNTKAAVVAFQRANGLAPDGVVGPRTMAALQQGQAITNLADPGGGTPVSDPSVWQYISNQLPPPTEYQFPDAGGASPALPGSVPILPAGGFSGPPQSAPPPFQSAMPGRPDAPPGAFPAAPPPMAGPSIADMVRGNAYQPPQAPSSHANMRIESINPDGTPADQTPAAPPSTFPARPEGPPGGFPAAAASFGFPSGLGMQPQVPSRFLGRPDAPLGALPAAQARSAPPGAKVRAPSAADFATMLAALGSGPGNQGGPSTQKFGPIGKILGIPTADLSMGNSPLASGASPPLDVSGNPRLPDFNFAAAPSPVSRDAFMPAPFSDRAAMMAGYRAPMQPDFAAANPPPDVPTKAGMTTGENFTKPNPQAPFSPNFDIASAPVAGLPRLNNPFAGSPEMFGGTQPIPAAMAQSDFNGRFSAPMVGSTPPPSPVVSSSDPGMQQRLDQANTWLSQIGIGPSPAAAAPSPAPNYPAPPGLSGPHFDYTVGPASPVAPFMGSPEMFGGTQPNSPRPPVGPDFNYSVGPASAPPPPPASSLRPMGALSIPPSGIQVADNSPFLPGYAVPGMSNPQPFNSQYEGLVGGKATPQDIFAPPAIGANGMVGPALTSPTFTPPPVMPPPPTAAPPVIGSPATIDPARFGGPLDSVVKPPTPPALAAPMVGANLAPPAVAAPPMRTAAPPAAPPAASAPAQHSAVVSLLQRIFGGGMGNISLPGIMGGHSIQSAIASGLIPSTGSMSGSTFVPSGFTAPNFSPGSGGATSAYQFNLSTGQGTYVTPAGNVFSYSTRGPNSY